MPGSGIRPDNIARIEAATGATEFHASARRAVPSRMRYDSSPVPVSYEWDQTDRQLVRRLVDPAFHALF
jgi:copper homeostasis protein